MSGVMLVGLIVVAVLSTLVGSAAGLWGSGKVFAATVVDNVGGGEWWGGWADGLLSEPEMSILATIIFKERLPRVLLGIVVGGDSEALNPPMGVRISPVPCRMGT